MGAGHAHALYVHDHTPVHRLAPEVKLVAAFGFVLLVALTPRQAVAVFLIDLLAILVVIRSARLPWRFVAARLLVVLPFVLFAFLVPFVASGERVDLLGLSVSRDGLWGTWNVIAKASLGGLTSITLAGTTEVADILRGLERLRVPRTLTAIAAFMIRYLEVLAGEIGRMHRSMLARGYEARWLSEARPMASAAGALFIRSYERGERVHHAMLSRGYTGTMPDVALAERDQPTWLASLVLPAVAGLALLAWLVVA